MADTEIYVIDSTDGQANKQFSIQPRTFNGYGGIQQSTDLTLYGNGAPNWGERFNENFYRLLENFACPESPGVVPPVPQTSAEIGKDGTGVHSPVQGQLWYNTTREELYVFSGSTWGVTTGTVGVGDIPGLQDDLDEKVDRVGDTMTGPLTFNNGSIDHLTIGDGGGNVGVAPDIRASASINIACDETMHLLIDTDNSGTGNFLVAKASTVPGSATDLFQVTNNGMVRQLISSSVYAAAMSDDRDIPNKKYVDDEIAAATSGGGGPAGVISVNGNTGTVTLTSADFGDIRSNTENDARYLRLTGGSLTGFLTLHADPTNNLHAATKRYVDDEITAAVTGGASGSVTILSSPAAVTVPGFGISWVTVSSGSVPAGSSAVILGGDLPTGRADLSYYPGWWEFRRDGSSPMVGGVGLGGGDAGILGIDATSYGGVIVPLTAGGTCQARRGYNGDTQNSSGTIYVVGYVS